MFQGQGNNGRKKQRSRKRPQRLNYNKSKSKDGRNSRNIGCNYVLTYQKTHLLPRKTKIPQKYTTTC